MTAPARVRLEDLSSYFKPAENRSQGRIEHRGPNGGRLRLVRSAERPADLMNRGAKRKDSTVPVYELVANSVGRKDKLPITDEERKARLLALKRAHYARKIAAETLEQREARRANLRAKNLKRRHKLALQAFRELQAREGDKVGQIIVAMRERHEAAVAFAQANGDMFTVWQMRRPYRLGELTTRSLQERIMRAGETVWRLDVEIRHGGPQRPWNGFTPGAAVCLSGKVQNFRPGTMPPIHDFTGDRLVDWRVDWR